MTNQEIITKETELAIQDGTIQEGEMLHTFQYWKSCGYTVKRGEHAKIITKLWKKCKEVKTENVEIPPVLGIGCDNEEKKSNAKHYDYILVKSFLFSTSQVEQR